MKKLLVIAGVIVLVILAGGITIKYKFGQMSKDLTGYSLKNIDMNTIPDGAYTGKYSSFVVSVELSAKVKDHKIEDISILRQSCGKGYEGRQVIDRILKEQSLQIDARTGATGSSRCILIALEKALSSAK
ncbi:MAG: FMN-binding protein [Chitinispirillaceae bacterium]|nr:FMN-binding protein [Chitinispirillaceae bacterium]